MPASVGRRAFDRRGLGAFVIGVAFLILMLGLRLWRLRSARKPAHSPGPPSGVRSTAEPKKGTFTSKGCRAAPDAESTYSSWSHLLKERRLALPSGQRALRPVVLGVITLIIVSGAFIAVGPHLPSALLLVASAQGLQVVRISSAVQVVGLLCAVAAWTLVITGLFFAHWKIRLAGLALLAVAAAAERLGLGAGLAIFGSGFALIVLLAILTLGILTFAADIWVKKRNASQETIRVLLWGRSILALSLVLSLFISQAIRLGGPAGTVLGSASVIVLGYVTVIIIIPMLILAGADVADIGGAIAEGISKSVQRRRFVWLAGISTVLAIGVFLNQARILGAGLFIGLLSSAALFAWLAPIVVATRPHKCWKRPLPALMTAAILIVLMLDLQALTGFLKPQRPSALDTTPVDIAFVHHRQPVFSMRHPSACGSPLHRSIGGLTVFVFLGCQPIPGVATRDSYTFSFFVDSFHIQRYLDDPKYALRIVFAATRVTNAHFMPIRENHGWATSTFILQDNKGISWARRASSRMWLLYGMTQNPAIYSYAKPMLIAMRDSWRPGVVPGPSVRPAGVGGSNRGTSALIRRYANRTSVLWLALALAATVMLLLRRRHDDRVKPALLYMVSAGTWIALTLANDTGTTALRRLSFKLEFGGVQALAALMTLCCVIALLIPGQGRPAWLADARLPGRWPSPATLGSLLMLNLSLLLVSVLANLYSVAGRAGGTREVFQGLVVILALLWELFFAGEMLNSGALLPRRARVLMYVGYLLLTAAALLQLGTLWSASSGARIAMFDSESIVRIGIAELGIPLAITLFLLSLSRGGETATRAVRRDGQLAHSVHVGEAALVASQRQQRGVRQRWLRFLNVLLPVDPDDEVAAANDLDQEGMRNGPQMSDPDRMRLELQQSAD